MSATLLRCLAVTEADNFGTGRFDPSDPGYAYLPERGYEGNDKAVVLAEIGGVKVKVIYFLQATTSVAHTEGWEQEFCGKTGDFWKISSTLDANGNSPSLPLKTSHR